MANNGLGRGLDSLIPKKVNKVAVSTKGDAIVDVSTSDEKGKILSIDPELININPYQPRKRFADNQLAELVDSIKEHGIIQPLIVTHNGSKYELIAGERRLRASKKIGLKKVPVIVRNADKQEKLELALIENIQREQLNPIETALAYRKLIDEFAISQDDLAKKVGKARPSVSNTLRLLNLPEEIRLALIESKITEGHAKVLAGLDNEVKQMTLFRKIIHGGLSIESATDESRKMGGTVKARIKINYQDKDKEFKFREFFGTKVEIKRGRSGGRIIIKFSGDDELNGMIQKLT